MDAATVPGRIELPRCEGRVYCGFIDPSGGRHDSFTLAVAHLEPSADDTPGTIAVDVLRERKPPR